MADVLKEYRLRIFNNVHKMLNDRGYTTQKKPFDKDEDIIDIYSSKGEVLVKIPKYVKKNSFTTDTYKTIMKTVKRSPNLKKIIIVVNVKVRKAMLDYIRSSKAKYKADISYINYNNLLFDLPRHELSYEHKLVEPPKSFNVENFPRIMETDPFSIWYGAREGDIFKIIRKSKKIITNINSPDIGYDNPGEIVYRIVKRNPGTPLYV